MAANATTNSTANGARATRDAGRSSSLAGLRAAWARFGERSRLRAELRAMSNRELADLGLRESDIEDVVHGRFARP